MIMDNKVKQKRVIVASVLTLVTALFYSQWEIPTFFHGKEFHNAKIVDEVTHDTGAMLGEPDFIKVISYDEKEAEILWVWGRHHEMVEMKKVLSKTGELEWKYYTWHTCTPANGAATCVFPWYGGFPGVY
jgi:hypothetical protein